MALNSSGPISLAGSTTGQSIAVELGLSATGQISLNDSSVRTLAGVASGAIVMPTDFYGKSNAFVLTIATNQTNLNLRAAAVSAGWNTTTKVNATINSGVYVSSNATGTPALVIDGSWPGGVTLTNNGTIVGMGGSGGAGGNGGAGVSGAAGGVGLSSGVAVTVTNNGVIAGGGGGGGGGAGFNYTTGGGKSGYTYYSWGGPGGGGGQSSNAANSSGGSGGSGVDGSSGAGSAGTLASPGSGGSRVITQVGYGGTGGTWGASGAAGGSSSGSGGSGGAGGSAVTGNSNITWLVTGTRYGAIV